MPQPPDNHRLGGGTSDRLAVLLCLCLLFVGTHAALEGAARFAERHLDAYLWKEDDYLRLFSPANHAGRGPHRLLILGPSEGREGLLPEVLAQMTSGLEPYQNSQSLGTLEDGLVALRYIEQAYGRSAVPDAILLGVTTRFVGNIRPAGQSSPLWDGINKYSPHFRVVEGTHPPALVQRTLFESVKPALARLQLQPERYRRGLYAIALRAASRAVPSLRSQPRLWKPIASSKYLVGRDAPEAALRKRLTRPGTAGPLWHAWDPERDRASVTSQLCAYRDFAAKYGIELYVVNLPEPSWNRDLYAPGRYETYLDVLTDALGPTPFLDLRTFLGDDLFFDEAHPTWEGGTKVSRRVGAFIDLQRRRNSP